jgi:hypothetical protein
VTAPTPTPTPVTTPTPTPTPSASDEPSTAPGATTEPSSSAAPGGGGAHRPDGSDPDGSGLGLPPDGSTTDPVAPGGGPSGGTESGSGGSGGAGTDGAAKGTAILTMSGDPVVPTVQRGGGPVDAIGGFVRSVADGIAPTVQPAAVAAVAGTFGFPLALMLAVLLFLIVQSRLDGRDPKLRSAPLTTADTFLPYVDEVRR